VAIKRTLETAIGTGGLQFIITKDVRKGTLGSTTGHIVESRQQMGAERRATVRLKGRKTERRVRRSKAEGALITN
jgi:hypothetical protein